MIIEIDTPGHTAVIAESHPDYIACYNAEPWWDYAVQPPAGQLRFANETVQDLAASLFEEVVKLTPGKYVGTGGDELNRKCMVSSKEGSARSSRMGFSGHLAPKRSVESFSDPLSRSTRS